jgi:hypothetical protein
VHAYNTMTQVLLNEGMKWNMQQDIMLYVNKIITFIHMIMRTLNHFQGITVKDIAK